MNPWMRAPGVETVEPTIGNKLNNTSELVHRGLLTCGILSSLLYVAMNIFIPGLFKGYSSVSQTVSELSAIGAPTRSLWVACGTLYTMLIAAFGWGTVLSSGKNRRLRVVGGLVLAYAFVSLFWPLAPMHSRETLASGGESFTDTMHLVLAALTVLVMTAILGFAAAAFGKAFRRYCIATLFTLLVFGTLTALDAPRVQANLPTPWVGVWERINIGVFLFWVIVLAVVLLKPSVPQRTDILS